MGEKFAEASGDARQHHHDCHDQRRKKYGGSGDAEHRVKCKLADLRANQIGARRKVVRRVIQELLDMCHERRKEFRGRAVRS